MGKWIVANAAIDGSEKTLTEQSLLDTKSCVPCCAISRALLMEPPTWDWNTNESSERRLSASWLFWPPAATKSPETAIDVGRKFSSSTEWTVFHAVLYL